MGKIRMVISKTITKRLMLTFISSYLFFTLLAVVIGSIVYMEAENIIAEEVTKTRQFLLNKSRDEIDTKIRELQQMSYQIAMDRDLQSFLSSPEKINETTIYKAMEIARDLKPYKISNLFMYDFYIYSPKLNKIINSASFYDPEFYFDNYCGYKESDYSTWLNNDLYKGVQNKYLPPVTMNDDIWPNQTISIYQQIPMIAKEDPLGILVMVIDDEQLTLTLERSSINGIAFIVNSMGSVISQTDSNFDLNYEELMIDEEPKEIFEKTLNGQEIIVISTNSNVFDWRYVMVVPKNAFLGRVNEIKALTLLVMLIYIFISLILAFFLSYKNYLPIKKIFDVLFRNSQDEQLYNNELDFIQKTVDHKLSELKELKQLNKDITLRNNEINVLRNKNTPMIKNSLLNRLADGKAESMLEFDNYLRLYDLRFPFPQFSIMIFHISHMESVENLSEVLEMNRYIADTVIEVISDGNNKYQVFEYRNESLAIISNFKSEISDNRAKSEMIDIASKVIGLLEEKTGITSSAGIGNIYRDLFQIHNSCKDALKALEYRIIRGGASVICYDEIITRDREYFYPIEHELQLINSVKAGDIDRCKSLLSRIFTENFENRKLPINLVKCLFFDIMSTAIKSLDSVSIHYTQIFGEEYEPLERITSCETTSEMLEEILVIYNGICQFINFNSRERENPLCEKIISYLEENYTEENLSQTDISIHFKITSSYLSRLFKQSTGQNMVDYINRLRIQKAKELLNSTMLTSNRIAEKVGCKNDKNLIRIFKQIEGITPGKYREYINLTK